MLLVRLEVRLTLLHAHSNFSFRATEDTNDQTPYEGIVHKYITISLHIPGIADDKNSQNFASFDDSSEHL